MNPDDFTVRYWGTSGSIASPLTPDQVRQKIIDSIAALAGQGKLDNLPRHGHLEQHISSLLAKYVPFASQSTYGGNTSCIEVNTPDALIILDAGTGIRELGNHLDKAWKANGAAPRVGHIFLSHLHADHMIGLPFCNVLFDERNHFTIHGSEEVCRTFEIFLQQQSNLGNRLFPPIMGKLKAIRAFQPINHGEHFFIGKTMVSAHQLNHPGGSQAYRISSGGKSFAFITDHEQTGNIDTRLVEFIQNATLVYSDGQFLLEEYLGRKSVPEFQTMSRNGWGHTPMEWCVESAATAGVKELHIGHKDPFRTDQELEQIEAGFQKPERNLRIRMAREGDLHTI